MNTETKTIKTLRSSNVKFKSYDQGLESFYNDLQSDYRKYFPLFLDFACVGYTYLDKDGNPVIVEPEEQQKKLKKYVKSDEKLESCIKDFIKLLLSGKTPASSCYNALCEAYSPNSGSKCNKEVIEKLLENNKKEFEKYLEGHKNVFLKNISIDDWMGHKKEFSKLKLISDKDKREKAQSKYWKDHIGEATLNTSRHCGIYLRQVLNAKGIKCHRPQDIVYCKTLHEMIRKQLSSVIEHNKLHISDLNKIKEKIEEFNKEESFKVICEVANNCKEEFCHYNFKNALNYIFNNKKIDPKNKTAIQFIIDSLLPYKDMGYKTLFKAFDNWEILENYQDRMKNRKYPLRPKLSDVNVPIENFKFNNSESFSGTLLNNFNFKCSYSFYFHNLEYTKIQEGYDISFNHRLKNGKKTIVSTSNKIFGRVKEISVLKKKNQLYLNIPYNLYHSDESIKLREYFSSASPDVEKLEYLPNTFKAVGIDLNIQDPVVVTLGSVTKENVHKIKVRDFGTAKFFEPQVLIPSTKFSDEIKKTVAEIFKIKSALYEIKKIIKDNSLDFSIETLGYLGLEINQSKDHIRARCLVQNKIKSLNLKIKQYRKECRINGNKNISELVRLIEATDVFNSMISVYQRLHLKSGQKLLAIKKNNDIRKNLKKDILKKLANKITKFCLDNKVSLVFLEDLNSEQSSRNSREKNSLIRLFSAKGILEAIESSLEKYGIYCVSNVDKQGTSKTNPFTGDVAYRDEADKRNLYVKKNNKILCYNSDKIASANILLRGIDHSVVPYSFYWSNSSKDKGKRISRFLKDKFGTTKVYFYDLGENQLLVSTKSLKNKNKYFGKIYYRNNKFITEKQHFEMEEKLKKEIKDGLVAGVKVEKIDITSKNINTCVNFQG